MWRIDWSGRGRPANMLVNAMAKVNVTGTVETERRDGFETIG